MAKILNPQDALASRYFVSCVNIATRLAIFDATSPQRVREKLFLLNDTLRDYELMDQIELIGQLKKSHPGKEVSELTWRDLLTSAGAVFTYRLSLGGMYEFTECFNDLLSCVSDLMHELD